MKEKLFAIAIGIASILFMHSCESEMPHNNGVVPPPSNAKEVNEWIYEYVSVNYPWDVKPESEADFTLHPQNFLKSLIRSDDEDSWVAKTDEIAPAAPKYDIGFEYAANVYQDGKIYYVIYYVKKGTDAESKGLERGYLVTTVNGKQAATLDQAETLLKDEVKDNTPVDLVVMNPENGRSVSISVIPQIINNENPIYAENTLTEPTTSNGFKVGYLMYNEFNANYDRELISKLTQFLVDNINVLVLDLRYNNGGSYRSSIYLGSALVKNRQTSDIFMVYKRKDESKNIPYTFVDKIDGEGGINIPRLGTRLNKIYIITGQYTSSISESFINALKAYWGNDLVLVGENTLGKNGNLIFTQVLLNPALENTKEGEWSLQFPMAVALNNKAEVSAPNYDFETGFRTDHYVVEVSKETNQMLGELGEPDEILYKAVLDIIGGLPPYRSVTSNDSYKLLMPSSLLKDRRENRATINIDELK